MQPGSHNVREALSYVPLSKVPYKPMLGEAKSLNKMYEGEVDSRGNPLGLGIRINECNDSIIIVEGMHMAERI